jgi:hypothetical protein
VAWRPPPSSRSRGSPPQQESAQVLVRHIGRLSLRAVLHTQRLTCLTLMARPAGASLLDDQEREQLLRFPKRISECSGCWTRIAVSGPLLGPGSLRFKGALILPSYAAVTDTKFRTLLRCPRRGRRSQSGDRRGACGALRSSQRRRSTHQPEGQIAGRMAQGLGEGGAIAGTSATAIPAG